MAGRPSTASDRILDFLRKWDRTYGPSYREIAVGVGLASTSAVGYQLNQLERDGLIKRTPGIARSIVLVEPA